MLGRLEDVEHELEGLSGELYGTVKQSMECGIKAS